MAKLVQDSTRVRGNPGYSLLLHITSVHSNLSDTILPTLQQCPSVKQKLVYYDPRHTSAAGK